jgi:hypothetical protein
VNCVDNNSNIKCELVIHVPNWTLARLELNDRLQIRYAMLQQTEDEKIGLNTRGVRMVDDVQMGENITIPSNDYDDPFWVMPVTICVHVL